MNKTQLDKTLGTIKNYVDGQRKIALIGSDTANTAGWYKVAEQTCSGHGDTNITFAVTSTYANYYSGILELQVRSDNTSISCKVLKWLTRIGFDVNHFIVVISGMKWTLYAYQPQSQYGRIAFEILSESSISSKNQSWTLTFKNNETRETKAPTATVKSTDGATVASANKLSTARKIKLTGDVTGEASFDGSGDASITATVKDDSHTHSTYLPLAGGKMTGNIQLNSKHLYLQTSSDNPKIGVASTTDVTDADGNATNDVFIANASNNYLRLRANKTMTYAGYKVYTSGDKPTPAEIGAATSGHNHDSIYLKLSGGTMTGAITSNVSTGTYLLTQGSGGIKKVTDQGGLLLHCDSSLFLHAGDNGATIAADAGAAAGLTSENINLLADGSISIAVNTQDGYAKATKFTIDKSGFSGNAGTATKLKTAKNINGTSFDGSTNITTANWGTARNIYIADSSATNTGSAVSVNGSGNATLKLPATIKASITGNCSGSSGSCTGNAATATKLQNARKLGAANFDGTGNVPVTSMLGLNSTKSSGSGFKNKFTKIASINVNGAWSTCSGKLFFTSGESDSINGILNFYFRSNGDNNATSIGLRWETLTNSSYADSIRAVKTSTGKYDLYYMPKGDYEILKFYAIASEIDKMTLYANQNYVNSITAAATSTLSAVSGSTTGNAGSATKLKTARSINGTNFDGTGNITTANWGTARTITIGGKGKSVNGSANVSWTLDEIGAAPKSHGTHVSYGGNGSATTVSRSDHTHNYITSKDTRAVNEKPNDVQQGLSIHLKSTGADGLSDGGSYHPSIHIKPWDDYSGGPYGELALTQNQNLWFRTSSSGTAWNAWKKVSLDGHTHNYAASSHNHTSLTGITSLTFASESTDRVSIGTTISSTTTYMDFKLADDAGTDAWRWRFAPSGGSEFNAMYLSATSNTAAQLSVTGNIQGTGNIRGTTLTASGNSKTATMGTGDADVYFTNSKSGKYLQLKDNGNLTYSDKRVVVMENYDYNHKIRGGSGLSGADGYITFSW